jgi:hypothetical protein
MSLYYDIIEQFGLDESQSFARYSDWFIVPKDREQLMEIRKFLTDAGKTPGHGFSSFIGEPGSDVAGKVCIEIPLSYEPYWEAKAKK